MIEFLRGQVQGGIVCQIPGRSAALRQIPSNSLKFPSNVRLVLRGPSVKFRQIRQIVKFRDVPGPSVKSVKFRYVPGPSVKFLERGAEEQSLRCKSIPRSHGSKDGARPSEICNGAKMQLAHPKAPPKRGRGPASQVHARRSALACH